MSLWLLVLGQGRASPLQFAWKNNGNWRAGRTNGGENALEGGWARVFVSNRVVAIEPQHLLVYRDVGLQGDGPKHGSDSWRAIHAVQDTKVGKGELAQTLIFSGSNSSSGMFYRGTYEMNEKLYTTSFCRQLIHFPIEISKPGILKGVVESNQLERPSHEDISGSVENAVQALGREERSSAPMIRGFFAESAERALSVTEQLRNRGEWNVHSLDQKSSLELRMEGNTHRRALVKFHDQAPSYHLQAHSTSVASTRASPLESSAPRPRRETLQAVTACSLASHSSSHRASFASACASSSISARRRVRSDSVGDGERGRGAGAVRMVRIRQKQVAFRPQLTRTSLVRFGLKVEYIAVQSFFSLTPALFMTISKLAGFRTTVVFDGQNTQRSGLPPATRSYKVGGNSPSKLDFNRKKKNESIAGKNPWREAMHHLEDRGSSFVEDETMANYEELVHNGFE
ncbi:hypothetical protein C8R47DRAFT_1078515 [Mycena vitilis]|nr:hypothetical protein C8R47DRAFT_1078515 [Mycena vitilis]